MMDTDPNVSYTSTEQDGDVELRRRRSNIHELHQYALCSQLSLRYTNNGLTVTNYIIRRMFLSIPTLATLRRSRKATQSYDDDVQISTNYTQYALCSQPQSHEQRTPGDEICAMSAIKSIPNFSYVLLNSKTADATLKCCICQICQHFGISLGNAFTRSLLFVL